MSNFSIKQRLVLTFLIFFGMINSASAFSVRMNVGDFCGNGEVSGVEECDDAANLSGDGCSDDCKTEFCGDSLINNYEICDGNTTACVISGYSGSKLCNPTCNGWNACISSESCGDGVINGNEVCDDGNNSNCDGCKSDCTRSDNICGDGYLDCSEECDGGLGVSSGYACTNDCKLINIGKSGLIYSQTVAPVVDLNIYEMIIKPTSKDAVISWKTDKLASCVVSWGDTQELSGEQIQGMSKAVEHKASIIGLRPRTQYFYDITCNDSWGKTKNSGLMTFTTEEEQDITAPSSVDQFQAKLVDAQVKLSWLNPKDIDFQGAKILRSSQRWPTSINDGYVVYNGKGESVLDTSVSPGVTYYYSCFAYDEMGNYSAAAITSISIPSQIVLPEEITDEAVKDVDNAPATTTDNGKGVGIKNVDKPVNKEVKTTPKLNPEINIIMPGSSGGNGATSGQEMPNLEASLGVGKIKINFAENNKIESLPGTVLDFSLPIGDFDIVKGGYVILSVVSNNEEKGLNKNYILKNDGDKLSASIAAPLMPGEYSVVLTYVDDKGNEINNSKIDMTIGRAGTVYAKTGNKLQPIGNALVYLYKIVDGGSKLWQASKYSQSNPVITDMVGSYRFFVENGQYQIRVVVNGKTVYTGEIIDVKNNIVNGDIFLDGNIFQRENVNSWFLIAGKFSVLILSLFLLIKNVIINLFLNKK